MPPAQHKLDAHTNTVYDLADILDAIAVGRGGQQRAQAIATKAALLAIEADPKVAARVLDEKTIDQYKAVGAITEQITARLKQVADDPVVALGLRFIAALRAANGDDVVTKWLQDQIQGLSTSAGGRATLTDSGRQSVATKTAQPQGFLAAAARGELGDPPDWTLR